MIVKSLTGIFTHPMEVAVVMFSPVNIHLAAIVSPYFTFTSLFVG